MDVVPYSMGTTARAWDEQHLDLQAAGGQIAEAPTSGFTTGVAGAAARFASAWQRHTTELGDTAETRADGLRTSADDYRQTDVFVADQFLLDAVLKETR
jgi:hypothetical protein